MEFVRIINTGGTFNKIYDPVKGKLIVPKNNKAIEDILKSFYANVKYNLKGIIFKDSLNMTEHDRELLYREITINDNNLFNEIMEKQFNRIIVVHGTDTMDLSAEYIAKRVKNKCIVFTGAMVPYSINQTEATVNFTLALSKVLYNYESGVFIAMHGLILPYNKIKKNKEIGKFEEHKN
jgi:L-asparaginase